LAESTLAERVAPRLDELDRRAAAGESTPTIAFLASGIEGIKVRLTAKAPTAGEAVALIDKEDAELRALLGTLVFGVDEETMETAVGTLLDQRGLSLGLAESMTGGLVASRVVNVEGSSQWFKGSVVCYDSQVKSDLLDVPEGPVVSEEAARAMAEGAARVLKADVGLSVTGVAGPAEQDGQPVGTVFFGLTMGGSTEAHKVWLPGDRERVRQFAAISLLDLLRRRLLES
jgi:nicotinamide-nucleotide amidase